MRIEQTRIRNLDTYLAMIPPGGGFRVVHRIEDDAVIVRMGLGADPGNGETVLPSMIGPVSSFNAEGRWNIRRDLPKERRYVRTVHWSWRTWNGEEHDEYRDIFRECYQRELVAPPSIELTFVEVEGERLIVSPAMTRSAEDQPLALHVINLYLELFRACEIVTDQLERLTPPALKKANWKLLPSGKYPWEQVEEHVRSATARLGDASRDVILDRQKALEGWKPDERWVGEGGFNDYMAYVFNKAGIVVLESLRRDNAIYVFKGDWRPVSRLTKAEIIQGGLHHARIVHSQGWKARLWRLLQA